MIETPKKIRGEVEISLEKINNISQWQEKIKFSLEKDTSELLDCILSGAISIDVSDIHIEPEEENSKLRARIDGLLRDIFFFDKKIYRALVSRLKLLSKLKLNITDKAQDGRFSILFNQTTVEVRTSVVPAEYGETIVLRL